MENPKLREEVTEIVKNADERLLKLVYAIALTYEKSDIVAHTTDGTPLSKEDYNRRLSESEKDIEKGNLLSTEDLKKEMANWKDV